MLTTEILSLFASTLFAGSAGLTYWTLANSAALDDGNVRGSELERERIHKLRQQSKTYRLFERLVRELTSINAGMSNQKQLTLLQHSLRLVAPTIPWRPLEFIACKQLEGVFAGCIIWLIFVGPIGILLSTMVAAGIGWFYVYNAIGSVNRAAAAHVVKVKRRLPFVVDLIALMLEAGASIQEALKTALRENLNHEVGQELAMVVHNIDMGLPQRLALIQFKERLNDDDVSDLIAAINKGDELGTPLNVVMRKQADQMRLKRAQWGEKAAAEAQVGMTFPALIVMLACMLLILSPFVVPLLKML